MKPDRSCSNCTSALKTHSKYEGVMAKHKKLKANFCFSYHHDVELELEIASTTRIHCVQPMWGVILNDHMHRLDESEIAASTKV